MEIHIKKIENKIPPKRKWLGKTNRGKKKLYQVSGRQLNTKKKGSTHTHGRKEGRVEVVMPVLEARKTLHYLVK